MSEILDGATITRMLSDYRVVANEKSVGMVVVALRSTADSLPKGSPEREAMRLMADAFSASNRVVLNIPFDRPGDESGLWETGEKAYWTSENRNLVCRLEESGAEVM